MTLNSNKAQHHSWGRYPRVNHSLIRPLFWRNGIPDLGELKPSLLPIAYGRSYGDSCLNEGGVLIDVKPLDRFMIFDAQKGILRCEAGVSLAEILDVIVPRGWFLPVVPGTKHVSVGGAIANDIHGKNHHKSGTFGCHVTCFELVRSSGEHLICSPSQNTELFRATIGGLGLTGLILWAELNLKPISSAFLASERIRFSTIDEFFDISATSDDDYTYTVAWIDCLAKGKNLGRGIFFRANHQDVNHHSLSPVRTKSSVIVPCDFPAFVLNSLTMKLFNHVYFHSQLKKKTEKVVHYDPFFFPLDAIKKWNRIYGRRGFLQYQCVVTDNAIKEILTRIADAGEGSFLAVLKKFGNVPSPGMLTFPREGTTLALDFPNKGTKTLRLLEGLDTIVRENGGAVYPAKDARMSPESFQLFFPKWEEFSQYMDPKFSSSFWRRVSTSSSD